MRRAVRRGQGDHIVSDDDAASGWLDGPREDLPCLPRCGEEGREGGVVTAVLVIAYVIGWVLYALR